MEAEVARSVQLLRNGATRGMVEQKLENEGLPRHLCPNVVESAQLIVDRRARFIAYVIAALGVLLIAGGAQLFLVLRANGMVVIQLPIVVSMFGVIIALYGLCDAMRRRH